MIDNIKYLKTAVEMLDEGQYNTIVVMGLLKTMRDVCDLNIARLEQEYIEEFNRVMERNLVIDALKGEQSA